MFGKRTAKPSDVEPSRPSDDDGAGEAVSLGVIGSAATPEPAKRQPAAPPPPPDEPSRGDPARDERYNEIKQNVFSSLVEAVDLTELGKLESAQVREEITDIVGEIIAMQNLVLSASEESRLITDICNDVLGLGPLEPLLIRDDIADIMVNGYSKVYIETEGKIELIPICID